ncbi:hypothetical protein BD324DRAFT_599646 [Kockovaella imperatae]|uniref:Uncharacterized protein n=1 Tax=Kockovaella imperatae TaxID=4999 RepID=A0A1Y1UKX1_9TREE|nr:hypothetical protein BD324DRAFT_599646 [Kockovaella imperatae]ORX38698.1 hypothetical protein BD324DRAFT_599646 [Kockovaella imperatae]
MTNLVQSVGTIVEAGVKGLMGLADGYIHPEGESSGGETSGDGALSSSAPSSDISSGASTTSSHDAFANLETLIRAVGVPSGWIHLPSTYLDENDTVGHRTVRSFGIRNVIDSEVNVEVSSDLGQGLTFWLADDEKPPPSSASTSSSISSTSSGTASLRVTIRPNATAKIYFAFQPTNAMPAVVSPPFLDDTSTPRVLSGYNGASDLEVSPMASPTALSSGSESGSLPKSATTSALRRTEPVHRAFSVHGVVTIKAVSTPSASGSISSQLLNLPFYATVCRSLFTSALIDPHSGLASGPQQSSGHLVIDFGADPVVGKEYHRDIMLVNRSECELVWTTAVVSAEHKDAVWFSLRDLDSENVFGVDTSSQPVPLPALSSRHLRLEMRVKAPIEEFEFDFVVSNVHSSGNTVTCRAIGSAHMETADQSLKVLSGPGLDFGQIPDGIWAKKTVNCKNTGSKPLDVRFSASIGHEVIFRLAGVAGYDMDDEVEERPRPPRQTSNEQLSRVSTREDVRGRKAISGRSSSRAPSVASSKGGNTSEPSSRGVFDNGGPRDDTSNSTGRHGSQPPSRPLSRVTSRSSYRPQNDVDSDEDDSEMPFFGSSEQTNALLHVPTSSSPTTSSTPLPVDMMLDKENADQIEELTMRPGTEYRIIVLYRPSRDASSAAEVAGAFRPSNFKIFLDSNPSIKASSKFRRVINCSAESCTSFIEISSGKKIDFGEVTVGASKTSTVTIKNLSALSARIEIAAISKVLMANRNVIVIPPFESVEEKLEFFPRRINDHYEKQIFVRNLLNRGNDQLLEIRSRNIDVYNLTIHSHLYRILTPSGSNFLDFGSVTINSPTVRSVSVQNLTQAPLVLDLSASQPEDVELYVKLEDVITPDKRIVGKYAEEHESDKPSGTVAGELKERFIETLRQASHGDAKAAKPKSKAKDKPECKADKEKDPSKQSIGAAVASALRKGGRGRPVQLYGNAVVFKDRKLLEDHEYLDLASGPPVSAHRSSPRSKKTMLLDTIELEDRTKLSGQHPKIPKLDFAASAKATGLFSKDLKTKKKTSSLTHPKSPSQAAHGEAPRTPAAQLNSTLSHLTREAVAKGQDKSPALTAKRAETKMDPLSSVAEISKMTVDELLAALEQHDSHRLTVTHATLEEEEEYVRRHMALRKELQNMISSRKLVPAASISVAAQSTRQLIAVMTPNGSTRPHITTKHKRADSRIFIRLVDFDRSLLSNASHSAAGKSDFGELPVRDLVLRSSCVRSVLEVQQSSINFGQCEKGEAKSKMIVIQNRSDCLGLFRLRTSGSIASGDLKLGLGRLGVIAAFGRKEIENFNFIPSLGGNFQENLTVENVLDSVNDQNIAIKAVVRKQPVLTVEPPSIAFGPISPDAATKLESKTFVLSNTSKAERTFVIEVQDGPESFAQISLARDDSGGGTVLSKGEEEEVETLLQKLKGAQRKGKKDKVEKYESRLTELGVTPPKSSSPTTSTVSEFSARAEIVEDPEDSASMKSGAPSGMATPAEEMPPSMIPTRQCTTSLSVSLQPNEKTKIILDLVMASNSPSSGASSTTKDTLEALVKVYDRKNTDEVLSVAVTASIGIKVKASPAKEDVSSAVTSITSRQDPLHLSIMRHCLQLTLLCPVSQTAFCVGSSIFLPDTSSHFTTLRPHFQAFPKDDPDPSGLLLGEGYSRQIPGNTHAEANALTNFRARYAELLKSSAGSTTNSKIIDLGKSSSDLDAELPDLPGSPETISTMASITSLSYSLPSIEDVLADSSCYATMEPCSFRTSGGPSCALELVKAKVHTVYLGVEEPPDFVQCEGVRILQDGGVDVVRVVGLEEECLKAARRGRN